MNKSEVEYVLIKVKSGLEEALNLKIYKDGTLIRNGNGGLPAVKVVGFSLTGSSKYFDQIMQSVSQQILDININHEEEIKTMALEYLVAFYGESSNGDTGERASWMKSTGLRFFMDETTSFRHNMLGFVDGLAIEALKLTNSWYFDVMMVALEGMKSTALSPNTIVDGPKTEQLLTKDFQSYFEQMNKKELPSLAEGKIYMDSSGAAHKLIVDIRDQSINYRFEPL